MATDTLRGPRISPPPEFSCIEAFRALICSPTTSFDRERVRHAVSKMSWRHGTVVGIVALIWGTTGFAATHEVQPGQLKSKRDATAVRSAPIRPDIQKPAKVSLLEIAKIRLDSPPPWEEEN